jgi:hypothetical protein
MVDAFRVSALVLCTADHNINMHWCHSANIYFCSRMMQSEAQIVTQYQTFSISKKRHQYLRYFLLISTLFQQCHSSGACSVCVWRTRVRASALL